MGAECVAPELKSPHDFIRQEHRIRKRTMQNLRDRPLETVTVRRTARVELNALFTAQGKSPEKVDQETSLRDFEALFGAIEHAMWSNYMVPVILSLLQSDALLTKNNVYEKFYLAGKGVPYASHRHNDFMSIYTYFQSEALMSFNEQWYREDERYKHLYNVSLEEPLGIHNLHNGLQNALGTLKVDQRVLEEKEGSNIRTLSTDPQALYYDSLVELSQTVLELTHNRKLAHAKREEVDPETMTRIMFADIGTMKKISHGKKAPMHLPWTSAWFAGNAKYDPIAEFDRKPSLKEVPTDSPWPTVELTHPSFKEGDVQLEGDCAARFSLIPPSQVERDNVEEIFARIDDLVPGRPPHLSKGNGEFDVVTMSLILGALIARKTIYKPGVEPVRYKYTAAEMVKPKLSGLTPVMSS